MDIFPADRVAPGKIRKKIQYFLFAINLLFNRGYTSGAKGLVGFIEKLLLKIVPKKYYRKISIWAGRKSRKWNCEKESPLIFAETMESITHEFPHDMLDRFTQISFNGKIYMAVEDKEKYLELYFGDYMTLPPENERVWKHHPIIVSFEHNYEDL